MADDTTQGQGQAQGILIPKERFDEVAFAAREARARAEAAERRYEQLVKVQQADAERLQAMERRFAPDPEPAWEDPAERAVREIAELRARLEERDRRDADRDAQATAARAIADAISEAGVHDVKAARERLADRYGAAMFFERPWNPKAEAAALRDEEVARAQASQRKRDEDTQATRSAMTGTTSAPAPATSPAKPRPTPWDDDYKSRLAEWEEEESARIRAEARAGGGGR